MKLYKGSKFVITVRPTLPFGSIFSSGTTARAFDAGDVLFDWASFKFPKNPFGAKLTNITTIVQGLDQGRVEEGLELYFAQSNPDGTSPPSFGVPDSPVTALEGGYFRNLLGHVSVTEDNFDDSLLYHAIAQTDASRSATADVNGPGMVLGSEALTSNDQDTYTHLYVAATCIGTPGFATNLVKNAGATAASTSESTITLQTGDPRMVFSIGDTVHAHDGVRVGKVVGFGSDAALTDAATKFRVDKIENALAAADELINLQPITLRLSFES